MKLATTLFVALALLPGHPASAAQRARYLMGTVCEVAVSGTPDAEARIEAAFAEASRIESMLSTWKDDSVLSRFNRGEIDAPPELRALLDRTIEWSRRTDRAFDPRIRHLIDLWQIREGGPSAIPSVARDLGGRGDMKADPIGGPCLNRDDMSVSGSVARERHESESATRSASEGSGNLDPSPAHPPRSLATLGMTGVKRADEPYTNLCAFEEGGFGKGYAIDRMLPLLGGDEAMVNFGGQVAVRGELRVTIADPERRDRPVVALTIANASLSTSSGSEKTFAIEGRRFSHIIDPRTGEALPPRGSVTVLADDALTADILSTALYVMGEDDGLRWADANGVAAIFINPQRIVRRTAKARERARDLELLDRNFRVKD